MCVTFVETSMGICRAMKYILRMKWILVVAVMAICGRVTAAEVDESPLAVRTVMAFPELRISRPVVITNAADGSNRLFVCSQQGTIHVFANDPGVTETSIYLDMESKVTYKDKENEEGLLGLAFHPNYKENGYFFVYYTTTDAPHTSVISRFQVSKDDPDKADPSSEFEIMRLKQPFWNHNGGTLAFGPDGYLYIGLGDGGAANDPHMNGQNLHTLLGSILRIDVDKTQGRRNYAIPKDNPFVGQEKLARGEIWAYGVRNIWRLSFDRETGTCWAGDVGQNLWEEIDIIQRGGNYGWNFRESKHDFGFYDVGPNKQFIEPIWEYHHDVGKSITGGNVYRGKKVSQLKGYYLYADYVAGKIWALKYDAAAAKVTENRSLESRNLPIITFGEDEQGEVYCSTEQGGGIIFRFEPVE